MSVFIEIIDPKIVTGEIWQTRLPRGVRCLVCKCLPWLRQLDGRSPFPPVCSLTYLPIPSIWTSRKVWSFFSNLTAMGGSTGTGTPQLLRSCDHCAKETHSHDNERQYIFYTSGLSEQFVIKYNSGQVCEILRCAVLFIRIKFTWMTMTNSIWFTYISANGLWREKGNR